jgi:hypothetical protein
MGLPYFSHVASSCIKFKTSLIRHRALCKYSCIMNHLSAKVWFFEEWSVSNIQGCGIFIFFTLTWASKLQLITDKPFVSSCNHQSNSDDVYQKESRTFWFMRMRNEGVVFTHIDILQLSPFLLLGSALLWRAFLVVLRVETTRCKIWNMCWMRKTFSSKLPLELPCLYKLCGGMTLLWRGATFFVNRLRCSLQKLPFKCSVIVQYPSVFCVAP